MKGRVIRNPEVTGSVLTSWARHFTTNLSHLISFFFTSTSFSSAFSIISLVKYKGETKTKLEFFIEMFYFALVQIYPVRNFSYCDISRKFYWFLGVLSCILSYILIII